MNLSFGTQNQYSPEQFRIHVVASLDGDLIDGYAARRYAFSNKRCFKYLENDLLKVSKSFGLKFLSGKMGFALARPRSPEFFPPSGSF